MAYNFNNVVFNEVIATNNTNYHNPTELEMDSGITPNTQLNSELVNSFLYKASAAIKQIQENGAIQYIPNKNYYEGNIVVCPILDNDNLIISSFVCIKDCLNVPPLKNIVSNDDNGFIYFINSDINEEYWKKSYINVDNIESISFDDFKKSGEETSDTDFRYVSFFEQSEIQYLNNAYSNFRLTIKRNNKILSSDVQVIYTNGICKINLKNIYCNEYSLDSTTSIFNNNSIFKDFALMGMFFTIDTNNKFQLCICPRNPTTSINTQIEIKLTQYEGNIRTFLKYDNVNGNVLNPLIKKIAFIDNASSDYNKSYKLCDTFIELSYADRFKRGLILLDGKTNADNRVYSFLIYKTIGNNFNSAYNLYTSNIKSQNKKLNNPILQNKLDSVENIEAQMSGVPYAALVAGPFTTGSGEEYGILNSDISNKIKINNIFPKKNCTIDAWNGSGLSLLFDASKSNNVYSDDIQDIFYLDSITVHKYIYFI